MSCWWDIVSQATAAELLVILVFSWVFGMVSRRVKSYMEMLGESVLVVCVSVISIVGDIEVSR